MDTLKMNLRLTPSEEHVVTRLRQMTSYSSEVWYREHRQPLLAEALAATENAPAGPSIDDSAEMVLDDYRLVEFWAEAGVRPTWRDGYVAAVPATDSPAARIVIADTSGHILITRCPVSLGTHDAIKAIGHLSVLCPWPGLCGRLRYHRDAEALVPASVDKTQWILLDTSGRNSEPFQGSCRLLALVLLIGGIVLGVMSWTADAGISAQAILTSVAAFILVASGELWKSARLWLRNLSRWTAVLTAGFLLDAATILVFGNLHSFLKGGLVASWIIVANLILLLLGISTFGLLVLFWPVSAGRNRVLGDTIESCGRR